MQTQTQTKTQTKTSTQWSFYFIVGGVLLVLFVSVILTREESRESNKSVSAIPAKAEIQSYSSSESSEIETDTAKRLATLANSGTAWGMSPFGSGKPLEESSGSTKVEFKKPNTEWKTRTISGITYVFGEGNPVGVAPLSEEEKAIYKKCVFNTVVYAMECPPPQGTVAVTTGYFNTETEKDLIILLNSPIWKAVLTNCEQQFRSSEIGVMDFEASYDRIMFDGYLNIENLIMINERDGRKTLSNNFSSTMSWFGRALRENKEAIGPDVLKLNNCITQYGGVELYRLMDLLYQKQFYIDGEYPDRLTDPKKYIPAY